MLPDELIQEVVSFYKAQKKNPPFSLKKIHAAFSKHNVRNELLAEVQGRQSSDFDSTPFRIYLNLVRQYQSKGYITLIGQRFPVS